MEGWGATGIQGFPRKSKKKRKVEEKEPIGETSLLTLNVKLCRS